jgi:hypothetical protein
MTVGELKPVFGCYSVNNTKFLRVTEHEIRSGSVIIGHEGVHEKSRDVLSLDRPVRVEFKSSNPVLVVEGKAQKIGIIPGTPMKLELLDLDSNVIRATMVPC